MGKFDAAFGNWVVKHRWWLIVASILAVLVAGSGLRFLTVNNDTRAFFSEENPQLQALEALENTYTRDQGILFVIAPRDGDVFTRKTLAAVEDA
jgi:predicted RND superfamily exporter protein